MKKWDKTLYGFTFIALAISLMSISLTAFSLAGVKWVQSYNLLLGWVSFFATIVFSIVGIYLLFNE